jgi:protein-L-isoaspartate O-methyltransferase
VTNYHLARKRMVEKQIVGRGIRDRAVIRAMSSVPRHLFVGEALRDRAAWNLPYLAGIVVAPTFRADGTILEAPGYDSRNRSFRQHA